MTTGIPTQAFARLVDEGEARWWLGSLTTIKATAADTAGQFTLVEVLEGEGEAPLHVHHREDEAFWVLEGEVDFHIGDRTFPTGPGSFVFAPRDIPHRYTVKRGPARMLFLFTPAGFEDLIFATSEPAPSGACRATARECRTWKTFRTSPNATVANCSADHSAFASISGRPAIRQATDHGTRTAVLASDEAAPHAAGATRRTRCAINSTTAPAVAIPAATTKTSG